MIFGVLNAKEHEMNSDGVIAGYWEDARNRGGIWNIAHLVLHPCRVADVRAKQRRANEFERVAIPLQHQIWNAPQAGMAHPLGAPSLQAARLRAGLEPSLCSDAIGHGAMVRGDDQRQDLPNSRCSASAALI